MTDAPAPGEVQAILVGELFSHMAPRYSVPLYQRNFTWGEEQIHRLIFDILDEAEQGEPKDYFLGNLVVAPPKTKDGPFDVIDGQQRLTTLYILLTQLRTRANLSDQIGILQPITYEAREKSSRALRAILTSAATSSVGVDDRDGPDDREDSGILRAAHIIEQLLGGGPVSDRILAPQVIDYLLNRVRIIRMPIDRSTDLNRYFEIMNTRGSQLSPVDIVKARLLRQLTDPLDRALLNHVWTACADMDHYVAMQVTSGDTKLRGKVFGPQWESAPTADFTLLRALLVDHAFDDASPTNEEQVLPVSNAMTFDEALASYANVDSTSQADSADEGDRFTSQITFPTLLLHVLAVRTPDDGDRRDDRQLDDKLLVSRFTARLNGLPKNDRAAWVRSFTTDLLRIRYLFDRFILKRDSTLASGHESTTDGEPGSWSLYRLIRGTPRSGGRSQDTPRYLATFLAEESGRSSGPLQRRILLLQSALRITYTSPRTMHWMTDVLRYVTDCTDRGRQVTAQGLLDRLEAHTLDQLENAIALDPGEGQTGPDGMPLGFAIPRIVFTYLDYLLAKELGQWDFTFSYRTSIEHFSPVTEDSEHASSAFHVRDRQLLDWLGNLALVTVSANSKFSNYLPAHKAKNEAARRQSLKLEIMARRAMPGAEDSRPGSWNDGDIRRHHEEMVALLRGAVADRANLDGR